MMFNDVSLNEGISKFKFLSAHFSFCFLKHVTFFHSFCEKMPKNTIATLEENFV